MLSARIAIRAWLAPRVPGQVLAELRRDQVRAGRVDGDGRRGRGRGRGLRRRPVRAANGATPCAVRRLRAPTQGRRLGQPFEPLGLPLEDDSISAGRQEIEDGVEQRRLAGALRSRSDHDGQALLHEEPHERGQLGVDGARTDQGDDRSRRWLKRHGAPAGGPGDGRNSRVLRVRRTGSPERTRASNERQTSRRIAHHRARQPGRQARPRQVRSPNRHVRRGVSRSARRANTRGRHSRSRPVPGGRGRRPAARRSRPGSR